MAIEVSPEVVRALAIVKQGFLSRPPQPDKDALYDIIRQIGMLQLDSVNVVARSHYLVMLARAGIYDREDLDALHYPDAKLFEQWAHAACLIPIEDYGRFEPVIMARRLRDFGGWEARRLGENPKETLTAVLNRIREEGPLASRDFRDSRDEKGGGWWDWKPAKAALEVLFNRGYLMIQRRENFQRYYDTTERVLPEHVEPGAGKTVEGFWRWAMLRGAACLGIGTAHHIADYYHRRITDARKTINALADEGKLLPVKVAGWKNTAYMLPEDQPLLELAASGAFESDVTAFLSPFDNLIWERKRVYDVWGGFRYRTEMYTPKDEREYGYYVMPILHRGRLVGRIDPKADRTNNVMLINAIYLEPGEAMTGELIADVAAALREFAAFHESDSIQIARFEPEALKELLIREIG
jgi:hypothetical protein